MAINALLVNNGSKTLSGITGIVLPTNNLIDHAKLLNPTATEYASMMCFRIFGVDRLWLVSELLPGFRGSPGLFYYRSLHINNQSDLDVGVMIGTCLIVKSLPNKFVGIGIVDLANPLKLESMDDDDVSLAYKAISDAEAEYRFNKNEWGID